MGHERTGIFDCMVCEGCITDFIILHWAPALTSLLEFEQCSKNHMCTVLVTVQNLPWFLFLQTPTYVLCSALMRLEPLGILVHDAQHCQLHSSHTAAESRHEKCVQLQVHSS